MNPSSPTALPRFQLRVWHMAALVVFAAFAIMHIQDQRITDPKLFTLACAGFALYGLLGWAGWQFRGPLQNRVGALTFLIIYLVGMAGLFFVATGIYVAIEVAYFRR